MYYVYLLKSKKDGNYYIGQTNNVNGRLKRHNAGQVKSTKYRRPFMLIGSKTFKTRSEARWCEYNLKQHSDKKHKFIGELEVQFSKSEDG